VDPGARRHRQPGGLQQAEAGLRRQLLAVRLLIPEPRLEAVELPAERLDPRPQRMALPGGWTVRGRS
jgi:hypothetical protein